MRNQPESFLNREISSLLGVFIIALVASLAIGGVIVARYYWLVSQIEFLSSPPRTHQEETFDLSQIYDCNELYNLEMNLIEKANYCDNKSDCIITSEIPQQCETWALANKNADLKEIKINIGKIYERRDELECPVYEICMEPAPVPSEEEIKCIDVKCSVIQVSGD